MSLLLEMFTYPFIVRAFVVGILVSLCAALLGVPLEHQRHTQQRRAQRDKDAHDEGADDEWVGKHLQQQAHAVSPPNRLP